MYKNQSKYILHKLSGYALHFLLIATILVSCKRKEETTWDIDVQAPIANTSLTLSNLIPDSLLTTNPDNSVTIVYQRTIDALNNGEFFEIPADTTIDFFNFNFANPIAFDPGDQFPTINSNIDLEYNDSKLTEMVVESGKVKYKVTSNVDENIILETFIPGSFDKFGNPFKQTIIVPGKLANTPGVIESEFDLNGYSFDLTGTGGTSYSIIEVENNIKIDPNGSTVLVSSQDTIFIESIVTNIKPIAVKGYLGQSSIEETDKAGIDFFDLIKDGSIDLEQVNLSLELNNYTGTDLQFKLENLVAHRGLNSVALNHQIINQQLNFSRATIVNNNVIPTVKSFLLDNNNSNIDEFIELLVDSIGYEIAIDVNPLGDISGGNDFLFADRTFELGLNINIPLSIIANKLTLVDTVDLNITDNYLNEGTFNLIAENSFPFDASIQFYTIDENLNITDSLFDNAVIYAGITNGNGLVDQPQKTTLTSTIPLEKMNTINETEKLIVKAVFNTTGSSFVNLYNHYSLDLLLTGDFNATAKIK